MDAASINFNITVSKEFISEVFDGLAKVERARSGYSAPAVLPHQWLPSAGAPNAKVSNQEKSRNWGKLLYDLYTSYQSDNKCSDISCIYYQPMNRATDSRKDTTSTEKTCTGKKSGVQSNKDQQTNEHEGKDKKKNQDKKKNKHENPKENNNMIKQNQIAEILACFTSSNNAINTEKEKYCESDYEKDNETDYDMDEETSDVLQFIKKRNKQI